MACKYRVHGTVSGKAVDKLVEANHGADALRHVVKPFIPKEVSDGRASRLYWWDENVRLDVEQLEPDREPEGLPEPEVTPAAKAKARKTKKDQ